MKLTAYEENERFIQLVLTNVGKGAAFNVNFLLGGDQGVLTKQLVVIRGPVPPINFIASGESEIYEMGPPDAPDGDSPLAPFPVDITYADVDGEVYSEEITLDVRQFDFLQWEGAFVAWRQMKAVETIAKAFGTFPPGSMVREQ